ncbi:hypothetical protein V4D30_01565 [Thermodesulfovibrio sp. 3907-1M]|uniref:Uncharacterized protein n=1 Tax=Thermodesulfovibrio autotrophicus TaxID=3118333 RepID=A0AAU8GZI0_9BACT
MADSKANLNFALPLDKLFEFFEESKSLDRVNIALYSFDKLGDYLRPLAAVMITKEQIYEMKGIARVAEAAYSFEKDKA